MHKSCGEVSLVEQDIADYVSIFINFFYRRDKMQLFSEDAKMFFFAYEKTPSKVAHNRLISQFLFHENCSPRDLCIMTLPTCLFHPTRLFVSLVQDFKWVSNFPFQFYDIVTTSSVHYLHSHWCIMIMLCPVIVIIKT